MTTYPETPRRFADGAQVRVTAPSQRAYPRRIWARVGTIIGHTYSVRTGIRRYQVRYVGPPSFDEDVREEHLELAEPVVPVELVKEAPTA